MNKKEKKKMEEDLLLQHKEEVMEQLVNEISEESDDQKRLLKVQALKTLSETRTTREVIAKELRESKQKKRELICSTAVDAADVVLKNTFKFYGLGRMTEYEKDRCITTKAFSLINRD